MRRIHEYEAWSKPGRMLSPDFGKEIQADVWRLGVPRDVFLGLSNIPDAIDVANLRTMLSEGSATVPEFQDFCVANGLRPLIEDEVSAAKFIEFREGCCVAWVHIPSGPEEAALLQLVKAAISKFDLIVVEP